jgi:hypothetical protein
VPYAHDVINNNNNNKGVWDWSAAVTGALPVMAQLQHAFASWGLVRVPNGHDLHMDVQTYKLNVGRNLTCCPGV